MSREYSIDLFNRVKEYFDNQGWKSIKEDAEIGALRVGIAIGNKLKGVDIVVFVGKRGITVYGTPTISADDDSMGAAAEFCIHANYGLTYGNFELDTRDGEMRFKNSLFCGDDIPSLEVVEFLVDLPMMMWDKYGNAFLEVVVGGQNPAEAVDRVDAA